MTIWRILTAVGLEILLFIGAAYLLERSLGGALKAVKLALKSEFSSDTGRLNLVGMVLLVFVFLVSNLHEAASNALSPEKPAPADSHVLGPVILFGLVFVGSLICVLIVETRNE